MSDVTRIEIKNFQSHADTTIEPAPAGGLTVITGPSDNGKSAILRALKWLYYNQPQGDGFRRVGCDFVEVTQVTNDGCHVARRRTSTTNRYIVDGQILEGFGNTVPLEVQQVTGVRTIRLGDQEILANLASQLDAPFLGSSISGPARAKVLGKLAGTEVIDRAARDLNGDLYRTRQDIKRMDEEAETLQQQIHQYNYLPKLEAHIRDLQWIKTSTITRQERYDNLLPLQHRLGELQVRQSVVEQRLASLSTIEDAAAWVAGVEDKTTRLNQLTHMASRLQEIDQSLAQRRRGLKLADSVVEASAPLEKALQAFERWQQLANVNNRRNLNILARDRAESRLTATEGIEAAVELIRQVEHDGQLLEKFASYRDRLATTHQRYHEAHGRFQLAGESINKARSIYTSTLREAGTCPVCGSELDTDHIEGVLAS